MSKLRPSSVPGEKAGPHGSFPIADKKHARLAIGGATRSERAGNISKSTEEAIKAKARAKLGEPDADERGGPSDKDRDDISGMERAMHQHADKIHPVK